MVKVITLKELAEMVGKSKVTVWRWWAKEKVLPAPVMINGRCIGWKPEVIEKWLDDNQG